MRILTFLVALTVGMAFYFLNPTDYTWVPKCPTKCLTGWDCPGCGFQRALHAALHGHWAEAINYNLFLIYSLPYLLCLALTELAMWGKWQMQCRRIFESQKAGLLYLVLFITWGIARNILGI